MTTTNCLDQTKYVCLNDSPARENEKLERKKKAKESEILVSKVHCVYKRKVIRYCFERSALQNDQHRWDV